MEITINKNQLNQKYQVNDINAATDEILVFVDTSGQKVIQLYKIEWEKEQ